MRSHGLLFWFTLAACGSDPTSVDNLCDASDATASDSAPDGVPDATPVDALPDAQLWPPTDLAISAGAATAADVDGDGRDDLIVAVSGGHRGIHVFRGGIDLDDAGAVIGVPDYFQDELGGEMALTMFDGLPVLLSSGGFFTLGVYDRDLSRYSQSNPIPYSQTNLTLTPVSIGAQGSIVLGTSSALRYLERAALRSNPPATSAISQPATAFADIAALGGDGAGALVVAEPSRVLIGTPPVAGGGAYTWAQRSLFGAPWINELVADVTADGRPDVIGYRKPSGDGQICVHNGADSPGIQPACMTVQGQNAQGAKLFLGELDPTPGPDLITASYWQPSTIDAFPGLHINVATVASGPRRTTTLPGAPVAIVPIDVDDDGDNELMFVLPSGELHCVALGASAFEGC